MACVHARAGRARPRGGGPDSAARSMLARPRVLCSSSRVAMKLGHMAPVVSLRQTPAPLHISTAVAIPSGKCSFVISGIVASPGP